MKKLTKEQVQGLSPEHQEAYGLAVARDFQRQLDLIARTRPVRWLRAFDSVAFLVITGVAVSRGWSHATPIALVLILCHLQCHTALMNRRLDALAELVEFQVLKSRLQAPESPGPTV